MYRSNYNSIAIKRALVSAFLMERDLDSFITLVQLMEESKPNSVEEEDDVERAAGQVLIGVVGAFRKERSEILPVILTVT